MRLPPLVPKSRRVGRAFCAYRPPVKRMPALPGGSPMLATPPGPRAMMRLYSLCDDDSPHSTTTARG